MLAQATINARPIQPGDDSFLKEVFASSREPELAALPWSGEQRALFLSQQYAAQHTHYFAHFPHAAYLILEWEGQPIGRYYLDRQPEALHILDLAILPPFRNRGIGTALLTELIGESEALGLPITLYVEHNNPAYSLYSRLGFLKVRDEGIYWFLERTPCK